MLNTDKMVDMMLSSVILFVCFSAVYGWGQCQYYSDWPTTKTMYCSNSCCGDMYNRYCCTKGTSGLIVGTVFGVIALIAIVVIVLVCAFCCCRKTRGQTGQVCQPAGVTTTVPMYGIQTTTTSYGQVGQIGYANAAFPQQIQVSNVAPGTEQKWQEQPPAYNTVNQS